jgi:hypothetical protein
MVKASMTMDMSFAPALTLREDDPAGRRADVVPGR